MIGKGSIRPLVGAATAALFGVSATPGFADGDAANGERLFRPCAACHQVGEGAVNRVGPHLNGLIGRRIGMLEEYDYSDTLVEAGAENDLWTEAALSAFLESPRNYMPGTSMVFRGIRDEDDRIDLIAYILQEGGPAENASAAGTDTGPSPEIAAILAIDGDVAYGEYLSSECTACHRDAGGDDIPSIAGQAPSVFITGLNAYRTGEREHPVMTMVASRLGDEEIAALAAYFEALSEQ